MPQMLTSLPTRLSHCIRCVPQRPDDGSWPVPKDETLVPKFETTVLEGDWYISAGLNKVRCAAVLGLDPSHLAPPHRPLPDPQAFDTFDCQLHRFEAPSPTTLVGNLQWRIKDPVAGALVR